MARIPVQLRFTPEAYDCFYGQASAIMVANQFAEQALEIFDQPQMLLVVSNQGRVRLATEPGNADAYIVASGACLGLAACILPNDYKGVKAAVRGLWRQEDSKNWPFFYDEEQYSTVELAKILVGVAFASSEALLNRFGQQERMISSLRRDNEELRLLAHRTDVLARASDNASYIAATIAPSDMTVGCAASGLKQRLPVTGQDVSIIRVYVSEAGDAGYLSFSVYRAATSDEEIASWQLKASDIGHGWVDLELPNIFEGVSDLILTVQGSTDSNTKLAMAKVRADRFGFDGEGNSLALQVIKVLRLKEQPQKFVPDETNRLSASTLSFSVLAGVGTEDYQAELEAALKVPAVRSSPEDQALYTHAIFNDADGNIRPTAAILSVEKFDETISIHARLNNQAAPEVKVAFIATGIKDEVQQLELVRNIFSGGDPVSGAIVSQASISGGDYVDLSLDLKDGLVEKDDCQFICAVCPTGPDISYADVVWSQLVSINEYTDSNRPLLSPVNIWDLHRDLKFIDGADTQEELRQELGFQPLLVQGDKGYIQVHPLKGRISAAVANSALPQGSIGARVSITNAHVNAPDFGFVLAAVDASNPNWKSQFQDLCGRLFAETESVRTGGCDADSGIDYTAVQLNGGDSSYLSLPVLEQNQARDLVIATIAVDGKAQFGWCRFYDLAFLYPNVENKALVDNG